MNTDREILLLEQLSMGQELALKAIFEQHYQSIYRIIYRMLQNKATAEDLSQEVFLKLWEKREKLNIRGPIGPYLRRMAVNEALGHLRKHKKYFIEDIEDQHDLAAAPTADAEAVYAEKELKQALNKAIKSLPPRCRSVFVLSRFDGLSYKEIGESMNISVKTVENQMGKALKVMRKLLSPYLPLALFIVKVCSSIGAKFF
ncbi:RNA polymerase sigma-70 factor [Saprospira grandis DSM 2844]|uniref:RNA polymerase sigma-70 factor n=1 Tax=Saprospira grandis DSM 2844 TaxID=694433 RepID=J0P640_9BACT|nr:RNA polymerase sigma-70 factor [Saprospira grandis]EJF52932.1 RNA polymerase sigma-70 factor [Saprospira grandis DSM 2844]